MLEDTDSKTQFMRSRLGIAAAAGVASGLLTLIDPAKLRPATRASVCLGTGALTGALAWFSTAGEEPAKSNLKFRTGFTLALTGLGIASTKLGFVADRKIHQALLKGGVANPRTPMAIGSGILTALTFLLEPPRAEEADSSFGGALEESPVRELSAEVRELIEGILAQTEDFGAPILREQLTGAQEQYWGGGEGFDYQLDVVVPEEGRRTVPRHFTFPVHADFTTATGEPMRVSLAVRDGHLDYLLLDVNHELTAPAATDDLDPLESITRWPLASEVTYSIEGPAKE